MPVDHDHPYRLTAVHRTVSAIGRLPVPMRRDALNRALPALQWVADDPCIEHDTALNVLVIAARTVDPCAPRRRYRRLAMAVVTTVAAGHQYGGDDA